MWEKKIEILLNTNIHSETFWDIYWCAFLITPMGMFPFMNEIGEIAIKEIKRKGVFVTLKDLGVELY